MSGPYYADESVTLYHGDCIEVMESLPDQSVDTVLTDPPYSSGGRRENSRSLRKSMNRSMEDDDWIRGDAMSTNGFVYLLRLSGIQWRRVLRPGGHLVWDKQNLGMGAVFRNQHEFIVHMSAGNPAAPQRRDVPNVLRFPAVRDGDHPTQKPGPLLETLLSVVTPPRGVVLDPFAGSGSSLYAARSSPSESARASRDVRAHGQCARTEAKMRERLGRSTRGQVALRSLGLALLRAVEWYERHETDPITDPPGERRGAFWVARHPKDEA